MAENKPFLLEVDIEGGLKGSRNYFRLKWMVALDLGAQNL